MFYTAHSNIWIDATNAKRWDQRIIQKKQNFCTCTKKDYIEMQSYLKESKYGKVAGLKKSEIG